MATAFMFFLLSISVLALVVSAALISTVFFDKGDLDDEFDDGADD